MHLLTFFGFVRFRDFASPSLSFSTTLSSCQVWNICANMLKKRPLK
uniref:Uncharacterized protein n=1 Tax=Rhizophora mucronata TaxID=61149 RepID=A0A2P2PU40_RHIMU